MKQDFNDSVDSMLRDYARRVGARESSVRESRAPERLAFDHDNMEHLDADEMAAFAENALPTAARARTVAHLADCNECRRFVVALTNAENIASESVQSLPPQIVHTRLSLREKLAAFFASHVALRYAVPAFAAVLFVALVAGVILNRRQPEANLVASKQESQTSDVARTDSTSSDMENAANSNASASSANPMADSAPVSNTATTSTTATTTMTTTTNIAASSRRAANANVPNAKRESPTTSASQNNNSLVNAPLVADLKPQPTINDRQRFDDDAARVTDRRPAAAPPSASIANANMRGNSAGVAAEQNEQVAVTSSQDAKVAKGSAGSSSNNDAAQTSDSTSFSTEVRAASRRRAASTPTAAKKSLPANGRAVNNADSSSAAPPALRRINGRDFRRQGTRWIDAAYVPSQSTTNITRGSKQYLTVVGAEPGIGKIAAQLDGEIIIVWKGRAYRIR
ncbi:MAG: hypothetical protein ACR2LC_11185 [Pyrinomonadaceae bacterium]